MELVLNSIVIPKFRFPFYGIIIVLSIIIGMIYIYYSLRKDNCKNKDILLFFIMYIVFALIFGKVFSMITDPKANNLLTAGLSSYGGVIGVIIASIIFEIMLPLDGKLVKYSIISLPLVYGLSKIACFISGCCYGIPYKGLFSVTYIDELNIELFPIQLVETITFLILFLILNKIKNNKYIIYITIIVAAILKMLLDFLRYSHIGKVLSTNQIFSLILVLIIIIVFIYNNIFKKKLGIK